MRVSVDSNDLRVENCPYSGKASYFSSLFAETIMYFPSACEVAVNVTYDTWRSEKSESLLFQQRMETSWHVTTYSMNLLRKHSRCCALGGVKCRQAVPLARLVPSTLLFSMCEI